MRCGDLLVRWPGGDTIEAWHQRIPPWAPWVVGLLASLVITPLGVWLTAGWRAPSPIVVEDGATLVVDRQALADVDLRLVHTTLVPDWVVARGGVKQSHWHRLRREAGRDANLGALLDRMDHLIQEGPVHHANELFALLTAWNDYLEKAGQPWRVTGEIVRADGGGSLRLKTYEVLYDDGVVSVGGAAYPASVRRRVDATTQLDAWLGHVHSHEEGVVLLLDELSGFALDRVWPMLDPALDSELSALQATFAPAIRREVRRALSPSDVTVLEYTAEDRMWLLRGVRSVHARHECGSRFLVARLPFDGLAPEDLVTLRRHAEGSDREPCPEVTELEALVFATRSHHLRLQDGLQPALERLVAWVARAVAIHEAQHAADVEDGYVPGWDCEGCPSELSRVGSLEASAYLASFATQGSAALSLFQACSLDRARLPERGRVIAFLAERLGPGGCDAPPPADLADLAQALQRELTGRSEPIRVAAFPSRLPIVP